MQYENAIYHILERLAKELPESFYYHNVSHTRDVLQASEIYCRMEAMDESSIHLVRTAAAYHDAGFLHIYDGHEIQSCAIAKSTLPDYGYSETEIQAICELILVTLPHSEVKTLAGKILCDADLDYLGRTDFFKISALLRREWLEQNRIFSEQEWIEEQIFFLEGHNYYTASARSLRTHGKSLNLEQLKNELQKQ